MEFNRMKMIEYTNITKPTQNTTNYIIHTACYFVCHMKLHPNPTKNVLDVCGW